MHVKIQVAVQMGEDKARGVKRRELGIDLASELGRSDLTKKYRKPASVALPVKCPSASTKPGIRSGVSVERP